MNKYVIFGGGVACGVLLVVVSVFVYVQVAMSPSVSQVIEPTATSAVTSPDENPGQASTKPKPAPSTVSQPAAPANDSGPLLTESIPLSRLPLTETQKQLVSGLGIDYDTFMITPDMATCAEGRLGRARVKELIAGAAPSFTELTAIARCL